MNKKNSWKIIVGHISNLKKHWKYTSDHASLEMMSVSQYYLSPKELVNTIIIKRLSFNFHLLPICIFTC